MARRLSIAPGLTLPPEAVTETFAIIAKRGVGKTYTGSVLAEEMIGIGAQVVILDPLDAWWGLRSSADGAGDGLPIYVFGGEHGDLPLEATAGELLADVVVDHGISAILSLRHLSKAKQRQFVAAFAERLYHRKGEPEHRTPLHVIVDEADAFVPQRVMADVARVHGALDDLVRRGRSSGIGVTLISQRAAVVSKDVLTQCEVLVALRTISPQDRKALDAWVEAHDAHDQRGPFMESLASLDVGEAWVWSPGWLNLFARVRIRQRRTFDSSATPKAGARAEQPKRRVDVDLEQLRERMEATIERARADDPKTLRARIAQLEREAAQRPAERVVDTVVERVEVPVLNGQVGELRVAIGELRAVGEQLHTGWVAIVAAVEGITAAIERVADSDTPHGGRAEQEPRGVPASRPAGDRGQTAVAAPASRREPAPAPSRTLAEGEARALGRAERALLGVLARFPDGRTKQQLSVLSGYSIRSSSFANALGALRSAGLATGREPIVITEAGLAEAGDVEPLPTGQALLDHWRASLGRAERTLLDVLVDAYPAALTRDELSERSGYSATSSSFPNALGKLRTLQLAEGYGETRATDVLFEGGR